MAALRWFWSPPRLWKALTDDYRRPSLLAAIIFLVSTLAWGIFEPMDLLTYLKRATQEKEVAARQAEQDREARREFLRAFLEAFDKNPNDEENGKKEVVIPIPISRSPPRPSPTTAAEWGALFIIYLLFEGLLVSIVTISLGIIVGLPSVASAAGLGSIVGLLVRTAFRAGAMRALSSILLFLPALLFFVPLELLTAAVGFRVATCLRSSRVGPTYIKLLRSGIGTWAKVIVPTTLLAVMLQVVFLIVKSSL